MNVFYRSPKCLAYKLDFQLQRNGYIRHGVETSLSAKYTEHFSNSFFPPFKGICICSWNEWTKLNHILHLIFWRCEKYPCKASKLCCNLIKKSGCTFLSYSNESFASEGKRRILLSGPRFEGSHTAASSGRQVDPCLPQEAESRHAKRGLSELSTLHLHSCTQQK